MTIAICSLLSELREWLYYREPSIFRQIGGLRAFSVLLTFWWPIRTIQNVTYVIILGGCWILFSSSWQLYHKFALLWFLTTNGTSAFDFFISRLVVGYMSFKWPFFLSHGKVFCYHLYLIQRFCQAIYYFSGRICYGTLHPAGWSCCYPFSRCSSFTYHCRSSICSHDGWLVCIVSRSVAQTMMTVKH